MKRIVAIILVMLLLLSGCGAPAEENLAPKDDLLIQVTPESENNEPENTEPENTEPENTEPENTTPENTEPENTEPENTEPENTEPENTEPENTEPENTEPEDTELDVDFTNWTTSCMTFNVLEWDTHSTGYAEPQNRAPWILDTIKRYDPDLLGCQEVTMGGSSTGNWNMYKYLVDNLTSGKYDVSGLMDSKDKAGSKVAVANYTIASGLLIFWKKDRFELKDSGAMVYSNDPGRHYQWVKLYDKQEDITILMTNTHMSINPSNDVKQGDAMRAQQGAELYQFWYKNCKDDMALYATGDYNHVTTSQAFLNMTQGKFVSTREVSQGSNASSGVDHILINGDIQDCYKYHRCNETYEGGVGKEVEERKVQFAPSDHYAIVAYCSNAYR